MTVRRSLIYFANFGSRKLANRLLKMGSDFKKKILADHISNAALKCQTDDREVFDGAGT